MALILVYEEDIDFFGHRAGKNLWGHGHTMLSDL